MLTITGRTVELSLDNKAIWQIVRDCKSCVSIFIQLDICIICSTVQKVMVPSLRWLFVGSETTLILVLSSAN